MKGKKIQRDQPPPPHQDVNNRSCLRISALNRDGKVSRSEFDGPANHFRNFDRSRDGYISSDEAPTGPPPNRLRPR